MSEKTLSENEFSQRTGVSVRTLLEWRKNGKSPKFIKEPGIRGRVRYLLADVERFEKDVGIKKPQ